MVREVNAACDDEKARACKVFDDPYHKLDPKGKIRQPTYVQYYVSYGMIMMPIAASVYGAIDNIGDESYQTVRGFNAPERTIRFGIETTF